MSVENNVFIERKNMPAPEAWLKAIREHGFEMDMDTDFDVDEFTGFLPCGYMKQEAGFEYFSEEADLDAMLDEGMLSQDEQKLLGQRRFLVTFATRSDFRDLMTSMIASSVLCAMADGMLAEGGEPPFIPAKDAIAWVKAQEAGVQKEIIRQHGSL